MNETSVQEMIITPTVEAKFQRDISTFIEG